MSYMDWYEADVEGAIKQKNALPYKPETIFYGSSSIRLWDSLYEDFQHYLPVNLGFGGSTLEACVYFFDRMVNPLRGADKLILYAGDNDLGDGKTPEQVLGYFRQIRNLVKENFAGVPAFYISIKPSIARWNINDSIVRTNELIQSEIQSCDNQFSFVNIYSSMLDDDSKPNPVYYGEDGLHLTKEGYAVWKEILLRKCFGKE